MSEEYRYSQTGDEPELKKLWKEVFRDEDDYIDLFFEKIYTPGSAAVCLSDGGIVSAAYTVKMGDFVSDGRWTPGRMIYAFATRPEYRGRGIGGRVLREALKIGSGPAAVVPEERGLFAYYEKFGFRTLFNTTRQTCSDVGLKLNGTVTRVTVRGYAALREELLHPVPHIDFDLKLLDFLQEACEKTGGGLYYVTSDGERCCAAAEIRDGCAWIHELILPSGSRYNAAALVARTLKCEKFTYRAPVRPGEEAVPFAMTTLPAPDHDTGLAWFGFALD